MSIGPLEELILISVQKLQTAYATDVIRVLNEAGYHFSDLAGSMYNILERLEAKGCVAHVVTPSRPIRGGRSRRAYSITAAGIAAITETEACRQKIRAR